MKSITTDPKNVVVYFARQCDHDFIDGTEERTVEEIGEQRIIPVCPHCGNPFVITSVVVITEE